MKLNQQKADEMDKRNMEMFCDEDIEQVSVTETPAERESDEFLDFERMVQAPRWSKGK
jgi:hypothetical protein